MDAIFGLLSHLGGCHGEWQTLIMALGSLPFVGALLRAWRLIP